jgi:hypothetical protein
VRIQAAAIPVARAPVDLIEVLATAATLVAEAAAARVYPLEDVARWCAEIGGVDPRLEQAALYHARSIVRGDVLIDEVLVSLRARLGVAGELFPVLVARGGVPRVLATLGLDDVDPPDRGLVRALPVKVARFYWQRMRGYVTWSAACAWPG